MIRGGYDWWVSSQNRLLEYFWVMGRTYVQNHQTLPFLPFGAPKSRQGSSKPLFVFFFGFVAARPVYLSVSLHGWSYAPPHRQSPENKPSPLVQSVVTLLWLVTEGTKTCGFWWKLFVLPSLLEVSPAFRFVFDACQISYRHVRVASLDIMYCASQEDTGGPVVVEESYWMMGE